MPSSIFATFNGKTHHIVTLMAQDLGHAVYHWDEMSQHDYDCGGKEKVIAGLSKELSNYRGTNVAYGRCNGCGKGLT